jgi:hypothetical protein
MASIQFTFPEIFQDLDGLTAPYMIDTIPAGFIYSLFKNAGYDYLAVPGERGHHGGP